MLLQPNIPDTGNPTFRYGTRFPGTPINNLPPGTPGRGFVPGQPNPAQPIYGPGEQPPISPVGQGLISSGPTQPSIPSHGVAHPMLQQVHGNSSVMHSQSPVPNVGALLPQLRQAITQLHAQQMLARMAKHAGYHGQ